VTESLPISTASILPFPTRTRPSGGDRRIVLTERIVEALTYDRTDGKLQQREDILGEIAQQGAPAELAMLLSKYIGQMPIDNPS
jgi:hypothetical protein